MATTPAQQAALHRRLLAGDPTASAEAAEQLLPELVRRLHRRWPAPKYREATYDAAVDVVVAYLDNPSRYSPAGRSLLGWLEMQAQGDLTNAYRSPAQAFERSWLVESSLAGADGDVVPLGDLRPVEDVRRVDEDDGLLTRIREAFPDETDRRLVYLVMEGDGSTAAAAEVLGVAHLPPADQAQAVKRAKDRIMKRLRRMDGLR